MAFPRACVWLLLGCAVSARAADLVVTPVDQDNILLHVLADPQCPLVCPPPTPCCDNFDAVIGNMNLEVPDLTMLNGDLVLDSAEQASLDVFLARWDAILGEKHFVLGNHEADPDPYGIFRDPLDHWFPAVTYEPLFRHGTPEYRRYYSIHVGNPPRVAVLALNNNSDSWVDDEVCYIYCGTPNDQLNHAGSPQRAWLEAEIDAMPSTVEVVLVCVHRTYYGVENYLCRGNVLMSGGEVGTAPAETLRTGETSFLRVLESIPERTNAERVLVLSGDQHCFAITHPIRRNVRDDADGIPFVVLGGAGAPIRRSAVYPAPGKIPAGLLRHAFDDKHFWTQVLVTTDDVQLHVREAYSDSLLFEASWSLGPPIPTATPEPARPPASGLSCLPNPVRGSLAHIRYRPPRPLDTADLDELAVYDLHGRRVRSLHRGGWSDGEYVREWDLTDEDGRPVASGQYYLLARAGARIASEKFTVIR